MLNYNLIDKAFEKALQREYKVLTIEDIKNKFHVGDVVLLYAEFDDCKGEMNLLQLTYVREDEASWLTFGCRIFYQSEICGTVKYTIPFEGFFHLQQEALNEGEAKIYKCPNYIVKHLENEGVICMTS